MRLIQYHITVILFLNYIPGTCCAHCTNGTRELNNVTSLFQALLNIFREN